MELTPEPEKSLFVDQNSDNEDELQQVSSGHEKIRTQSTSPEPIAVESSAEEIAKSNIEEIVEIDNHSKDDSNDDSRNEVPRSQLHDLIMPLKKSIPLKRKAASFSPFTQQKSPEVKWTRFIGELALQGWATRPTARPLRYQESLEVKRLVPKKMTFGRSNSSNKAMKFGDSAVIRLFSIESGGLIGREIGRLPTDITDIISPLIDLKILECTANVILETESRLSIGDSFYLQVNFHLTLEAFNLATQNDSTVMLPNLKQEMLGGAVEAAKSNWNYAVESSQESALRLRQSSLVRLFDKLNIKPDTKGDSASGEDDCIEIDDDEGKDESTPQPIDQLNVDQLKQFYQTNQQSELLDSLPETTKPPSENFKMELRPYQKKGLSWMLAREKELGVLDELSSLKNNSLPKLSSETKLALNDEGMMNPLWKTYKWPKKPTSTSQSEDEYFYANMYSGELSITKPIIKSLVRGGILADEMGLGKTISTLSLINSVPLDMRLSFEEESSNRYASNSSLIVVPMSLLSQWQSEFEKANNNPNHRCIVYYGDQTVKDLKPLLCQHRNKNIPIVVLTTYGTILKEYIKALLRKDSSGTLPKTGIYSVKFFRVILDEGHTIRNRSAKTTKAIYEISLSRKWVLTGTPVINRLDDLYSIVKFLELEPWSNFSYWKTFVTLPFEQKKIGQTLDVVKSILEPIFLRRTKNMKQKDGQPLVVLPPKEITIEEIEFNEKEQKLYDWFKSRAAKTFREGLVTGELLKKYTQILTHILRLRQVCCHMDLVGSTNEMKLEGEEDAEGDAEGDAPIDGVRMKEIAKEIETDGKRDAYTEEEANSLSISLASTLNFTETECSICTLSPVPVNEMGVTGCGHIFCINCILEHIAFQNKNKRPATCPNCRELISKYKLFKVKEAREVKRIDASDFKKSFLLYLYDADRASSKIQALIQHLRILNSQHPGEQVVVFSQFSSYLDIIERELNTQCGSDLIVYKFDGRLHMNERKKILEEFANNKVKENLSSKTTVLLLSLKAGGVGLNLTSASRAFMMDPWWSPSVEDQAIDRIHRIGQVDNVKVVRFIMRDSIEKKMLKIQERKKQIGEAVAEEEDERAKRRIEEIQMLFEE